MNLLEQLAVRVRHNPVLSRADWLWNCVRPLYEHAIAWLGRKGLRRTMNGIDRIVIVPEMRGFSETYETRFWTTIMNEVRPGDRIAEVGAYIGLYTIALGQRVGPTGSVTAFEPDATNFAVLERHVRLNRVEDRVDLVMAAVGASNGNVTFEASGSSQSRIRSDTVEGAQLMASVRLDSALQGRKLDILKIDVEGFEEQVLEGASDLLADPAQALRAIYIEVHPYTWNEYGTSSESLMSLLENYGYRVFDLEGRPVSAITTYGHVVARPA